MPSIVVTGKPVCFVGGHQDDILIMMGHAAAYHALVGREVHGFTGTLGDTSIALTELNGSRYSGVWGDYHYPYPGHEGYQPLTPERFAECRDKEDRAAAAQLGILPGNFHSDWPGRKSSLNLTEATAFMESIRAAYPTAGIYTHHWQDSDSNHKILGQALRNLRLADPIAYADVRFFVRQEQVTDPAIADKAIYSYPTQYQADVTNMVLRACDCFCAWNPESDMFAIGDHSVHSMFTKIRNGFPNYMVKPVGW